MQTPSFGSSLYYRLNVVSLYIPSFSERGNEVITLTHYFLEKYQILESEPITEIDSEVINLFLRYPWPGNIRELENAIERACILTTNGRLSLPSLPVNMLQYSETSSFEPIENPNTFGTTKIFPEKSSYSVMSATETEKQLIIEHLTLSSGNIKKAADSLGISRRTLYRKLEKHKINLNQIRFSSY